MSALGKLVVSLALDHTNFSTGLSKSETDAKRSADNIGKQFTVLRASFASLTGLLVGGSFTAWVKSSIDAADTMRDLAIATGTNVQALASYELAAQQSGTTIDAVAAGMGRLSLFMAKNSEEAAKLGITAQDPAQAMIQLAAALEKAATPADRNALANQVLGKSYAELMPLLAQGGAELRAQTAAAEPYAKKMAEMADKADAFNDNMATLGTSVKGLGLSLAGPIVSGLNHVISEFEEGDKKAGKLTGTVYGLAGAFEALANGLGLLNTLDSTYERGQKQLVDLLGERAVLERQLKQATSGGTGKLMDMILGTPAELRTQIADVDKLIAMTRKSLEYIDKQPQMSASDTRAGKEKREAEAKAAEEKRKADAKAAADKARADRLASQKDAARMAAETMKYEFDAAMEVENYRIEQETKRKLAQREAARQIAGTGFAGDSETMDMIRQQAEQISQFYSQIASGEDVTAAFESSQARLNSIRQRLDAEVGIGAKSQTAAQIELRQETGKLGDELASHLIPRLNELIATAPDDAAREKWRALYAEIGGMQAAGQQIGPWAGLKAGLNDYAQTTTDTFATVKDAVGGAFKGMEDALSSFVKTGKLDFKSLAGSIIDDLLRIQLRASITGPLASMFGNYVGGLGQPANIAAFSSANFADISAFSTAFAKGGTPDGVSAWRNQVVDRPTFFKFASGGVFGEAGPEAIMPLARGPDGNLGVRASGSGGNVQVIINNNATGAQATQSTRSDGKGGSIIDVFIEQVKGAIAGDIARGNGAIPAALGRTYGLNPTPGMY
jgi:lambda family phage tail tape measure protein